VKDITIPLTFKVGTLDEIGMGGFKTGWVSAEQDGTKYEITSGAGLGNARLEASARRDGKSVYASADIRTVADQLWPQLAQELIAQVLSGGESPDPQTGGESPEPKGE
jgi:hypothetical protein